MPTTADKTVSVRLEAEDHVTALLKQAAVQADALADAADRAALASGRIGGPALAKAQAGYTATSKSAQALAVSSQGAASAAEQVGRASATSASKMEQAYRAAQAAAKRQTDAVGSARVAEARLAEVRKTAAAGSARLLAAEEAVARAHRNVSAAQSNAARTTQLYVAQQEKAATASRGLAVGLGAAVGSLVGGALVGVAAEGMSRITEGIVRAKDAARDLAEAQQKSQVVFGANAAQMDAWSKTSVTAFGLSQRAAVEASASFGDMFTQLGFTGQKAVQMSQDVVGLAADLGAMNNIGTADVLDRISAGFRGEYDSLQLLVPNISAARVEQEAMAASGVKSASSLTAQQKAAAVLSIIHKDGAKSAGFFKDNLNSAAEQEQVAAANAEQLAASFGNALLPAWTGVLTVANKSAPALTAAAGGLGGVVSAAGDAVGALTRLPAPIQTAVAGLVAFRLARGPVEALASSVSGRATSAFETFRTAVDYAGQASARARQQAIDAGAAAGSLGTKWAGASAGVRTFVGASSGGVGAMGALRAGASGLLGVLGGPWGLAFTAATAALGFFMQRSAEAKQRQEELRSATEALTGTLVASSGAWTQDASKQLVQMAGQRNLIANYQNMGYSIESVTSAITKEGSSRQAILGQIDAQIARLTEEGRVIDANSGIESNSNAAKIAYYQQQKQNLTELIGVGSQAAEQSKLQAAANDAIAQAATGAAGSTKSYAEATKEAASAAKAANEAITALANTVTKGRDAQATYWAAVDETTSKIGQLSGAVLKGGSDFDVQTARGRDAQAQLLKLGNAARDAALQQLDLGKGVGDASKQMDVAKTQFIATAHRMGLNKAAAAQLAEQLGLTDVAVRNHAAELGRIPGNVTTTVQVLGLGSAITQVSELMRGLREFDNTSVTAVARVASMGSPFAALRGFGLGGANGLLLEAFARGGFHKVGREEHVAQIARAGTWRVWAEDETGGEAYIPLAPGKRARSVAILEEVARRFGMAVTAQARGSILSFASGGVAAGPVRGVTGAGVVGRIAPSALTVPITAVIAKVVPPKTPVPAPFLYTAGGPWDRSKELAKVNAAAITEAFKRLFVSKDMVAEALGKLRDARAAAGLSRSDGSVRGVSSVTPKTSKTTARAAATNTTVTRTAASRAGSVNLVNASRAATAQGKAAGAAVVATQAKATAAMRATVAAKTTPASARAAAIANALSMNGRGSYKWGGGHQDGYYRNSAALAADCSGFVGWAIGHALGRNATSTAAGMLGGNKSLGYVRIDPRIAAKTAGAIMGSAGHVVMSLGDGRVVESYKTGKPVRIRKIASRDYSMAAWNSKLGPMTTGTAAQITGGMTGAATGNTQSELNNLAQAQADYARLLAASKIPAYRTFAQTTVATTKVSRAFLANIRKIRDRGFPLVAARLLEMGEDDGGAVAQSFASASTAALRQQTQNYQQNASYEDLRAKLSAELGKVAGPPAWVTASRENATTNAGMATFLANIAKINTRGFGTLAAKLLEMGVEEGGDIARQAVTLTDKDLRNLRGSLVDTPAANAKRAETVLGPRWVQAAQATVKATATSAAFLANIRKIRDRGFPTLALKLMELGEETASGMAAEAATATDKDLRNFRDSYTASEAMQKEADALLDQLKGIGQVLNISVGQSTGTDPQVRWTAPRAVDARAAMPAGWANNVRTVPSGPAVQVTVENMHAANPSEAGTQLETRIGDAVAVSGIGRVI